MTNVVCSRVGKKTYVLSLRESEFKWKSECATIRLNIHLFRSVGWFARTYGRCSHSLSLFLSVSHSCSHSLCARLQCGTVFDFPLPCCFNTMYVWYIFKVARAFYPRAKLKKNNEENNSLNIPFSRDGLNVKIFSPIIIRFVVQRGKKFAF